MVRSTSVAVAIKLVVPFVLAAYAVGCSCQPDPKPAPGADSDANVPDLDAGGFPDRVAPPAVPVGEPCVSSDTCEGGICAGGTCAERGPECASDEECDSDTYCCDSDCSTGPVDETACIPYGQGPRGDVNEECTGDVVIGVFAPSVQCEWSEPPANDPFPDHTNVLATPMVADLPNNSGASGEIVIVSYNFNDGGDPAANGTDSRYFGVIRILNAQNCETLENIHDPSHPIIAASPPAIADLDGDGRAEIVTHRALAGLIAFKWNTNTNKYETFWVSSDPDMMLTRGTHRNNRKKWDGPAIHDLDNDGVPEVISATEVYNGLTGERINNKQNLTSEDGVTTGLLAVIGDVDNNGDIELVGRDVWTWDDMDDEWTMAFEGAPDSAWHFAFADFGTPGNTVNDFDPDTLDGVAEIVSTGNGRAQISTLGGQVIMEAIFPAINGGEGGGPPTIGDFDNDGFPEFALAGATAYRVMDLDCQTGNEPNCAFPYIRWLQPSQDLSSRRTGSSIFDFDSDGKAEAVYADECYTRVYDGESGEVLYSAFRSSCTWYENAVIADPDQDENTEILVNSNQNCPDRTCPAVDAIHRGQLCEENADCPSNNCNMGFCRCDGDDECLGETECLSPPGGTPGTGKTCRAVQGDAKTNGLRILRDVLDRWASSRGIWNQHAYSVTNINEDLTVPESSKWTQNFTRVDLNNYRQNVQGATGAEDQPDITGRTESDVCRFVGDSVTLTATVCNRGNKAVGAAMPATFYEGDPDDNNVLCVSYTNGPVPVGGCLEVSCEIDAEVGGEVTMVVNDDGEGGRTTLECNDKNNRSSASVISCLY